MRAPVRFLLATLLILFAGPAASDIFARNTTAAGSVIARKSGEEAQFIELAGWRNVDLKQDLLGGDVLRTNAYGHLAILFSDRTQIRLGRNTTLLVKSVGAASDSEFRLQAGTIWARAERGGVGLTVETPAAAAAIRGTDWTLTVGPDGTTSLIVMEGLVELANAYGAVRVAGGEAAVASIGKAPSKVVIVAPDDREQMLFYLSVRNAFTFLPASPETGSATRQSRSRILAIPEDHRSPEDWTTLAEAALTQDGTQAALVAVRRARLLGPDLRQTARLDLVEAMAAGAHQKYEEAARLFAAAAPRLDPRRRAIAAYGGYFARALANPDHIETPPSAVGGGPYAAIAEAWTAGFLIDVKAAIDVLRRAERQYPDDPTLPAARAQFAILLDDREQVKEAIGRSLQLDPGNPDALQARATLRADFEGDLAGALSDLQQAASLVPGSSGLWNSLALVQSLRGASREAEAAFLKAIDLDPYDAAARANYAIFLLDQDRVAAASDQIDRAIELDPEFHVALVARGRYHLQNGEREEALQDLLAGSTANPAYAQALLLLAAAHFDNGETEAAEQAIDNAERLDPNDPVVSSFMTAVAIDDFDAEKAIDSARLALERTRARGGDYAPLSANQESGSILNSAFRLQGLDAWGRYYGDAVFNPFAGASLVDQAISGSPDPFAAQADFGGPDPVEPETNGPAFSSFFQGLMLSPEMLSGRSRSANLVRRPFFEATAGGGIIDTGGDPGWTGEAEVQAFGVSPFPASFYGRIEARDTTDERLSIAPGTAIPYTAFDLGNRDIKGNAWLTARPTPQDRAIAYLDVQDTRATLSDGLVLFIDPFSPFDAATYDRTLDGTQVRGGVGLSHTFGFENVASAAFFVSGADQQSHEEGLLFAVPFALGSQTIDASAMQRSYVGAASHAIGFGDFTLRYGVEGGYLAQNRSETTVLTPFFPAPPTIDTVASEIALEFGRAYVDGLREFGPDLQAEAGVFVTGLSDPIETVRVDPRAGIAWSPAEGQWLRAAYIRETSAINETTLSPVGILGLQANQAPMEIGGYANTLAARWDAEWTDRFFTSLDYQHQQLHDLAIPVPAAITTIGIGEGRIDRAAATANLRLGYGFGLFGTVAWADSANRDPASPGFGMPLPFVPEFSARTGLTFVHPSNLRATIAGTYVGARAGNVFGDEVGGYWTLDAFVTWETPDKRLALDVAGYNLLDEDFDVAPATPGWGRSLVGKLKIRF